jgi:hypothetical protein
MGTYPLAQLLADDSPPDDRLAIALLDSPSFRRTLSSSENALCWICGAAIVDIHCKIVCQNCGFTRDCSDP